LNEVKRYEGAFYQPTNMKFIFFHQRLAGRPSPGWSDFDDLKGGD
jgi:hypothetical protein